MNEEESRDEGTDGKSDVVAQIEKRKGGLPLVASGNVRGDRLVTGICGPAE
jgi:hypothetical protein